jgi:hypothetical protein
MSARPFGGLRPVGCRVPFGHHGSSGAAGTRSADAKFTNSGFAASLQGFVPLAGWGLVHGSPRSTSPGSPGFLPPWGLPLPWPRSPLDAESSSQVLRARSRSGFLFPVLQSFKEPGSRPGLSRGCLPLRGFRPRPVFRRLPERSTGVGAFSLVNAPPSFSVRLHCVDYALLPKISDESEISPWLRYAAYRPPTKRG